MKIRGIQKTSLVDFPGRISTVIFFGGCNFRCGFCHNPDLVKNDNSLESFSEEEVLDLIKKRSSLVDGVVITGGEPTLAKGIDAFLHEIKKIPLYVKLDTNGSNPDTVKKLIQNDSIDYAAVDIKTSADKYNIVTGVDIGFGLVKKTIEILKGSGLDYEVRTTCIPEFVDLEDFKKIKADLGHVRSYYLQQFVNKVTLDPLLQRYKPYSKEVLNDFREYVKSFSDTCEIRGI